MENKVRPSPAPAPAPPEVKEVPSVAPRDGEPAGTTIVININAPPPSPAEPDGFAPAFYPVIYPVASFAALPVPIGYPRNHHFLGYGLDISSPGLFGGLGLNAGNRFGLKTGSACGQGYDCLFAPR